MNLHSLFGTAAAAACLLLPSAAGAQQPGNPPPDDRFKSDILVIAPHPDDESTIAGYLAKAVLDEHRRVSVVLTTRGDAGQNLVGYEQGRTLGEIREIEIARDERIEFLLLQLHRVGRDGGGRRNHPSQALRANEQFRQSVRRSGR